MPDSGILEDGLLKTLPGVKPGAPSPAPAAAPAPSKTAAAPAAGGTAHRRGGSLRRVPLHSRERIASQVGDQDRRRGSDGNGRRGQARRNWNDSRPRSSGSRTRSPRRDPGPGWRATGYYAAYYATAGFLLGSLGAIVSLLFNVDRGAPRRQEPARADPRLPDVSPGREGPPAHPGAERLRRQRPRDPGVRLLPLPGDRHAPGDPGLHGPGPKFAAKGGLVKRLIVASVVSLLIWAIMFYGILSWLQPLAGRGRPRQLDHQHRRTFPGGWPRRRTWSSAGPSPCSTRWASTVPTIGSPNRPRDTSPGDDARARPCGRIE